MIITVKLNEHKYIHIHSLLRFFNSNKQSYIKINNNLTVYSGFSTKINIQKTKEYCLYNTKHTIDE